MKIVTAIDSMKGSLTSKQANQIVADVFRDEKVDVTQVAIADGGEGTVEAFVTNADGEVISAKCHNLLGDEITADYGWLEEEKTAVIESAATCGIQFLKGIPETHPQNTNSYGLGEQILSAAQKGAKRIIIGLGGTGTIDGGIGLLACLGVEFFDNQNQLVSPIPRNFKKITRVDTKKMPINLNEIEFIAAADVKSVITGRKGAVYLFGEQKGLQVNELAAFEEAMKHYSQLLLAETDSQEGDGAAGGIGLALRTILHAKVVSGLDLIAELSHLPEIIQNADLVITGEGKIDSQSLQGKVPVGIGAIAQKYQIPVIVFVGAMQGTSDEFEKAGLSVIIPIVNEVSTLNEALKNAESNLRLAAERTKKLLFLLT
ncbi:glycerate kinase [Enterococcus wangshanyuanii]|uniref:Glycerate kinase n=1 Tax=Enterococcus wangshanyuanii TaxID=2005703 RepID=A0ABQ1NT15_9ENTE|nr:glycerate kinase [Enterococcus wangshanyuanii]GGC79423.1 glycerate kinase [Enterococcus wangshanyuanii]